MKQVNRDKKNVKRSLPLKVCVVVPCYNESLNLYKLKKRLDEVTSSIQGITFDYLFVDDGSRDDTVAVLSSICQQSASCSYIELSRNFGKEAAVTCGIHHTNHDAVIIMDADLQHPPEVIKDFVHHWVEEGFEIVSTQRVGFENRSLVKRLGSWFFYLIYTKISSTPVVSHTTDFRLIDRVVVDELKRFTEHKRMVRGLIDWLGFKKTHVQFSAPDREHGDPGYSFIKLAQLAISGLTSFSFFPLRLSGYLGLIISILSGIGVGVMFLDRLLFNWGAFTPLAFVAVLNLFVGGLILSGFGLVSLYIENIYTETQNRPIYVVREHVTSKKKSSHFKSQSAIHTHDQEMSHDSL